MPERNDSAEHWRHVVGYEKLYTVSTHGRVVSLRKGRLLKQFIRKDPRPTHRYMGVWLSVNGVSENFLTHRLVLTAFHGPCPKGQQCRHLDGNPLNNSLYNLAWGTREEDWADRLKHGKGLKLTPELVRYIRSSDKPSPVLAAELGCTQETIRAAGFGRTWGAVVGKLRKKHTKLTPTLVRYIRSSDKSTRALAAELGCGKMAVHYARTKKYWAHVT